MTNKRASEILYHQWQSFLENNLDYGGVSEAYKKAFKALQQEPILNKIRDEIKQEYKLESEHPYGQGLRRALEIIDKYKESEG